MVSLLFWGADAAYFHSHRQDLLPEQMARTVNEDFRSRESEYRRFTEKSELLGRLFADSLTEQESEYLNSLPFYVYAYNRDTLMYWNTNKVIGTYSDTSVNRFTVVHNEKGVFIQTCSLFAGAQSGFKLVFLFPLLITYPLENEYLKSHFAASDYVPAKTKILWDTLQQGTFAIKLQSGKAICNLKFNAAEMESWEPDRLFALLLAAALLTGVFWIQLIVVRLTAFSKFRVGLPATMAIVILIRLLLNHFGLPFNLDALAFFSPKLFNAGIYGSSLGDLFINILLILWVIIFFTRHTPYKSFFEGDKRPGTKMRYLLSIGMAVLPALMAFRFSDVVRSLVMHSGISFDVSHFYAIDVNSILGLLAIGSMTGLVCMVIYLVNVQLNELLGRKARKYILMVLVICIIRLLNGNIGDIYLWLLAAWILVFAFLLDVRNFTLVSDLFEPHMIFWAVFICGFCTGVIGYFNQLKERADRCTFVEQRLSPHRDTLMENYFDRMAPVMMKDKIVRSFFDDPGPGTRKLLNQRLETQYLTGALNGYQSRIYVFNEVGEPMFNKDTTNFSFLTNEKNESVATGSDNLFYKESILDRHYYLASLPVYDDSELHCIGYLFIDLDLKKRITETVYPELLQPPGNMAGPADNEYAYAIYINDKLVTQTNDYPFTLTLKNDTLKNGRYAYYENGRISELHYKIADKRTAVVVHYHSEWLESITLFSYLFGIQVLLAIVILVYRLFFSYFTGTIFKVRFLNLRRRVHFSMLAVIFVSFIIIGSVTILFFTVAYKSSNSKKLQSAMQVVKQSVQEYLKPENAFATDFIFDSVSRSTRFKYFITNIANSQKIDINIFDDHGTLFSSSQDEIYEKGLISRKIRPDAFFKLNNMGKSLVIQEERVAGLSYLSAYQPLRNEEGVTLGYLGVPFFSSERDLNFQISNIVVTLINLYAFIFLVSGIITVVITRWIVRTFNIITRQFELLNLEQNERLMWPYDDEIGKLVDEYNKMVQKVEANAVLLAKSERESAWREMARQVAHEIKNPLTPMKLNIQYLQQAVRNNSPNLKQLADRVSESVVEQIDNLSYIASEFSNFAKMPEARPEELDLCVLLASAGELYQNTEHLELTLQLPQEQVIVVADKSQLLRVFTNLLENAKQAIPDGKMGRISIAVEKADTFVTVSITDNGVGIAREAASRIFEPYFTTKTSGTGLGLAMTKKIIELWQGEIGFESESGQGTTFFVKLRHGG